MKSNGLALSEFILSIVEVVEESCFGGWVKNASFFASILSEVEGICVICDYFYVPKAPYLMCLRHRSKTTIGKPITFQKRIFFEINEYKSFFSAKTVKN